MNKKLLFSAIVLAAMPIVSLAAVKSTLTYGVWLPFWKTQDGAQNISVNLDKLTQVSPFSYRIAGPSGELIDDLKINSGLWDGWFSAVRDSKVKIIPTIAWFDGPGIHTMLSNAKTRQAEEDRIAALVQEKNFDGIDIDFESMLSKTRPYYSLFIQGLAIRLHPKGKLLACTVMTHTPPAEIYDVVPASIVYPENYTALDKWCDEVRLMAYDQQTISLKLNALKGNGNLYSPIADPDWVESVVKEAMRWIRPKKIVLGVPTYGYEYQVSWYGGVTTYERVRAFSYFQAMGRADSLGIEPKRNNAGELAFTFTSSTYIPRPSILISTVQSTLPPELNKPIDPNAKTTFFVSFPDSESVLGKINLAKRYGIKGIMLFKADGDIDPMVWEYMK